MSLINVISQIIGGYDNSNYVDPNSGTECYFFGDSITGYNIYQNALCTNKGWVANSYGISGTTITTNACRTALDLATVPTKGLEDRYLFFAFGVNDQFVNTGSEITAANYQTAIENAISNAFGKGWAYNRIYILSPFYTTYDGTVGYCSSYATDSTRKELFVSSAAAAAATYGTGYVDIYHHMENNGAASLLEDTIHPNSAGFTVISNYLISLIN